MDFSLSAIAAILTAFTLAALTSCAGAPAKPVVRLGVIDYPANEVIENQTGAHSFNQFVSIRSATYRRVNAAIESNGNRVPLASYDGAVCFVPKQWEVVQNYLDALRAYIQNHCGNQ